MIILAISFLILTGKSKSITTGSLIQPPVSPEQTTVTATNIDMSSWKTYVNSSLGVTLQYPPNWIVNMDDKNAKVTIKADPTDRSSGIEISSLNKQNYVSLSHWLTQVDKDCEEAKQLSEKTGGSTDCIQYKRLGERKINQYTSSKILWNCCGTGPTIRYFIEGPDKIYFIDLLQDWDNFNLDTVGDYDEGDSKLAKIYQQIFSTFNLEPVKIDDTQISVTNTKTGKTTIIDKPKTVHPDIADRDINSPYIPVKLADSRFEDTFKDEFDETLWKYSFSPDNSKLAFVDANGVGIQQIVVINLSIQKIEFVTIDDKDTKHPLKQKISWSPNSTKIAFTELDSFGTGAGYDETLFILDTQTKSVRELGRLAVLAKLEFSDIAASTGSIGWIDNNTIKAGASTVSESKEFTLKID